MRKMINVSTRSRKYEYYEKIKTTNFEYVYFEKAYCDYNLPLILHTYANPV